MNKYRWIIGFEFRRHVMRRGFLLALLSVPLMIAVLALAIFLLLRSQVDTTPLGYIDYSGLLSDPLPPPEPGPPEEPVPMLAFETEAEAQAALTAGEIQAYYVLPANYAETGQVISFFLKDPKDPARDQFKAFLLTNLLSELDQGVGQRLIDGDRLTVRSEDGRRQLEEGDWVNVLMPFFSGMAFIIAIFISSGYFMQAVVDEKENRTMEILVTSISPQQLIAGKVIGIIGVGLTQILAWLGVAILGVVIGRVFIEELENASLSASSLGMMALVLLPAYVMISSLMVAVGATVTDAREGQQMTGLFTLPVMIPYWFAGVIMSNPNSPVALGLSLFPLTSPVALTLRMGFSVIPTAQLAASLSVLVLSAAGATWLAGRAFRLGMLRYGKRVTLGELFRSIW